MKRIFKNKTLLYTGASVLTIILNKQKLIGLEEVKQTSET